MMKFAKIVFLVVAVTSVSACSTVVLPVGAEPSSTPPKLLMKKEGRKELWNDSNLFGRVPPELEAMGAKLCGANEYAHGYHPKAQDYYGNTFAEGGFLCLSK